MAVEEKEVGWVEVATAVEAMAAVTVVAMAVAAKEHCTFAQTRRALQRFLRLLESLHLPSQPECLPPNRSLCQCLLQQRSNSRKSLNNRPLAEHPEDAEAALWASRL
jgi:hypothetical protein